MYNSKKKSIVKWIIFSIVMISVILINKTESIADSYTSYAGILKNGNLGDEFKVDDKDLTTIKQGLFCAQSGTDHPGLNATDKTYIYRKAITIVGNYSRCGTYKDDGTISYTSKWVESEYNGRMAYALSNDEGAFTKLNTRMCIYSNSRLLMEIMAKLGGRYKAFKFRSMDK